MSKLVHQQEYGVYSSRLQMSQLTLVLVLAVSVTAHSSWILILHETLSCLWHQMKGSVGVTVKECKTCLNIFVHSGHMIHQRFLLTVTSRPSQMQMLHPADNIVGFLFLLCNCTQMLHCLSLYSLIQLNFHSKMCKTTVYQILERNDNQFHTSSGSKTRKT